MLRLSVPLTQERWDEENQIFIQPDYKTLELEHSLVSLSKWESKWGTAFISRKDKTVEETIDYVRCMTLTQNVDPNIYNNLTSNNIREIDKYINTPMTATVFSEDKFATGYSREIITAELIYHWMFSLNIPLECQEWHLNRLVTMIRVQSIKNTPPKKMSAGEIMRRNAAINAVRRKELNTKG